MDLDKNSIIHSSSPSAIASQSSSCEAHGHELLAIHAQQLVDSVIKWHMQQKDLLQNVLPHLKEDIPNADLLKSNAPANSIGTRDTDTQLPHHMENVGCLVDVPSLTSSIGTASQKTSHTTERMVSPRSNQGRISRLSTISNFVAHRMRRSLRFSRATDLGSAIRRNSLTPSMPPARSSYATDASMSLRSLEGFSSLIIVANAITIGIGADYDIKEVMESGRSESHITFRVLEVAFTMYYVVEIIMRMWMQGAAFCSVGNRNWNILDLCLVIQACGTSAALVVLEGNAGGNLSFLRMLRLFKMIKPLRMFRLLRFFRELRLILRSIFDCVKSVIWALVLLTVMAYSFGLIFVQATTHYLVTTDASLHDSSIQLYWGSISLAINSLFMTSFGGEDWTILASPLWNCGRIFYMLFLVYVLLFHLVLLNTISSLFFEAMISNAQNDQAEQITFQMEKSAEYTRMLSELYRRLNPDGDGEIEYAKFIKIIETQPELRAFAESLDIDLFDARQFFMILSGNGKYRVDLEAFVVGCTKLKGCARSIDMLDLLYFQRNAVKQQDEFFELGKEHLATIKNHLNSVLSI